MICILAQLFLTRVSVIIMLFELMVSKPGAQLAHLTWYPKSAYDPLLMISFRILKWLKHVSSDASIYKYTSVTLCPMSSVPQLITKY